MTNVELAVLALAVSQLAIVIAVYKLHQDAKRIA